MAETDRGLFARLMSEANLDSSSSEGEVLPELDAEIPDEGLEYMRSELKIAADKISVASTYEFARFLSDRAKRFMEQLNDDSERDRIAEALAKRLSKPEELEEQSKRWDQRIFVVKPRGINIIPNFPVFRYR